MIESAYIIALIFLYIIPAVVAFCLGMKDLIVGLINDFGSRNTKTYKPSVTWKFIVRVLSLPFIPFINLLTYVLIFSAISRFLDNPVIKRKA